MRMTTPLDNARLVELDVLLGRRGLAGQRAVRYDELLKAIAKPHSTLSKIGWLNANVPMPNAATWYDGPTFTLGRGTWLVNAAMQFYTKDKGILNMRLFDGNDGLIATQQTMPHDAGGDVYFSASLSGFINLTGPATITLQACSSTASANLYAMKLTNYLGSHDATRLSVIQIGI